MPAWRWRRWGGGVDALALEQHSCLQAYTEWTGSVQGHQAAGEGKRPEFEERGRQEFNERERQDIKQRK